jgi:hypothetical protein
VQRVTASVAMRFLLALVPVLGLAVYGCATDNGDADPAPDFQGPTLDAGKNVIPDRDAGTAADAGLDAPADAPTDAPADAAGPSPSDVRIAEVYVDNNGGGDTTEFIELRGAPGTALGELKLRLLKDDGTVGGEIDVANTTTDKMPTSGLWVIGGGNVITVDPQYQVDHLMFGADLNIWGLDSPRGAVQLVRGTARTLIDVVGYDADGDAGALPAPPSAPTATAETAPTKIPVTPKRSFGRKNNAADTNDNRADFCPMAPTAGRAQAACE